MLTSRKSAAPSAAKTLSPYGIPGLSAPQLQNKFRVEYFTDVYHYPNPPDQNGHSKGVLVDYSILTNSTVSVEVDLIEREIEIKFEQFINPDFLERLKELSTSATRIKLEFLDGNGNITAALNFQNVTAAREWTFGLDYASAAAVVHKLRFGFK